MYVSKHDKIDRKTYFTIEKYLWFDALTHTLASSSFYFPATNAGASKIESQVLFNTKVGFSIDFVMLWHIH